MAEILRYSQGVDECKATRGNLATSGNVRFIGEVPLKRDVVILIIV